MRQRPSMVFRIPSAPARLKAPTSPYLTGTATREASEGSTEIEILSKASSDRFLSASLDEDIRIPAGNYGFQVGDDEVTIRFSGGKTFGFRRRIEPQKPGAFESLGNSEYQRHRHFFHRSPQNRTGEPTVFRRNLGGVSPGTGNPKVLSPGELRLYPRGGRPEGLEGPP